MYLPTQQDIHQWDFKLTVAEKKLNPLVVGIYMIKNIYFYFNKWFSVLPTLSLKSNLLLLPLDLINKGKKGESYKWDQNV